MIIHLDDHRPPKLPWGERLRQKTHLFHGLAVTLPLAVALWKIILEAAF